MRDLDLRRLRMFVTVVESPSLRIAAEELAISQQSLSVAIRELEAQLGVDLFSRSKRSLVLTKAGEALYEGAVPLLAVGTSLTTEVRKLDTDGDVPYSIGHTPAVAPSEAFEVIEGPILADPTLAITVRPIAPDSAREELLAGTIDLALTRSATVPSDLAGVVAFRHELRLAVHARHPLASAPTCSMSDVSRHPIVVSELETDCTPMIVSYCRDAGFEPTIIVSKLHGIPPHMAVLVHQDACTFVTNQAGWVYHDQIRVVSLTAPPQVPVMAMWLPSSPPKLRNRILDLAGTRPTEPPASPPCRCESLSV
ncbi:LysR family transcriptional regulator [Gordonia amarae]|uniref:LysR family transcriptional regulator n=2 Tax=Gordonia amarae TaxID=36821 RepID=A0A857LT46_9ACTN|nr:LysR family transcriptional regulator [Gordonia amarae]MCS3881005.1 DNA-binding transcriptional LysR family regulator [Gordonia amarae]QHN19241.1 LysR family transcriptional regulator [Gordonia amarae]QHN23717.1 LysR family transcriptional regulator [Gordonia amarae]QHN32629.1 LysR family transcriptional regulator [Gordonia amarae]QHN41377.1 LysR family transcriptional regulator [Gordonia amarae]